MLLGISKSICKIEYLNQKIKGTGFLVKLPIPDSKNPIRGIITSNHILNETNLYNTQITLNFIVDKIKINVIPEFHFIFSDPFLDVTFIELKNHEYDRFEFINIKENQNLSTSYYIINLNNQKLSNGNILKRWGFKLYHEISIDDEFLGSPLVSKKDNKIFGIHTKNNKKFNVAINMQSFIQAISFFCKLYKYKSNKIIQKNLSTSEINELKNHGLLPCSNPQLFMSPSSQYVTPLWFYRTNYAWYWTPTEPENNDIDKSNWIIIYPGCSLKVVGGKWDGIEPAERNINLIRWLETTGLDYLSTQEENEFIKLSKWLSF